MAHCLALTCFMNSKASRSLQKASLEGKTCLKQSGIPWVKLHLTLISEMKMKYHCSLPFEPDVWGFKLCFHVQGEYGGGNQKKTSGTLHLFNVTLEDDGMYICVTHNPILNTSKRSKPAKLNVQGEFMFFNACFLFLYYHSKLSLVYVWFTSQCYITWHIYCS